MKYLVYLHSLGLTHKNLHKIFEKNSDYETFYNELCFETLKKYIEKEDQILKILELKKKLDTKSLDKKISNLGVQIVTIHSKHYPENLKQIAHPPYFLYVRGKLIGQDNFFAVVGSRKISPYAKKVGESLIPELTQYFTIVSGGAGGCDTLAHKLSVENNAKTVVVFGTGIDITYPAPNIHLFEKVIETGGTLVSIFPIGTPGGIYTFPVRNEIVSGMSRGILVLEAGEKSGTLITANLALDQGKDLFAIPGDIFNPNHAGTNNLIKNSEAKLVCCVDDILGEYNYKNISQKQEVVFENDIQKDLYNLLKFNLSLSIDDCIEKTQYEYGALSLNLAMMELTGMIKKDMFGKYGI